MGIEKDLDEKSENVNYEIDKINDYSIYDYFYDKPAVLLTASTLLVSLMSFFFSLLVVSYKNQLLSFWGLDYYSKPENVISFSVFTAIFIYALLIYSCNYLVVASTDAFIQNTCYF